MMIKIRQIGFLRFFKLIAKLLLLAIFLLSYIFPRMAAAKEDDQFVTIVNPVRLNSNFLQPERGLSAEYQIIKEAGFPATWLLSFDALKNKGVLSIIKHMDQKQEFGVFLEVTPDFAKDAGVEYHNTGFWYHANSIFLSGYTQEERKLLIDLIFREFKNVFGYYPASVGSWWTDSYSLSYIKEKYGVLANLTCSDQFSTDGYKIWGQPWSLPYYPSKFDAGVPAVSNTVKLGVVNLQWAPRDPLNGYYNSKYSTQDYPLAPKAQNIDYFKKLVDLYSQKQNGNDFGQITVGLEADLDPLVYQEEFLKQITYVNELEKGDKVQVVTMTDFAKWYKSKFLELSPATLIKSQDFLGTNVEAVWYQSPNYRIFYTVDNESKEVVIRDLRVYSADYQEPYYVSPNRNFDLAIYVPSVFDEINLESNIWKLPKGSEITLFPDKFKIKTKSLKNPKSGYISVKKTGGEYEITFLGDKDILRDGILVKGFTSEAVHFLKQKKALLSLLTGKGWNYLKKVDYLVPQDEVVALKFLSSLTYGKVMVYDNECLQCEYHTAYKPAVFANQRNYVGKYSKRPIIYNSSVFKATTRKEAKVELQKTGAKYIYLAKFEDYKEELPFSPGDLGIEKIFSNANAEIWRVE